MPDGVLNFIPFEALLTENSLKLNEIKTLPYLLKKHQISYNYSATLFGQLKEKSESKASNDILAFAPKFGNEALETIAMRRNGLGTLKYNGQEVEAIDNLFNTNVFKDELATKANFMSNAQNHKIIHLSTHAKSNDVQGDDSFIAFSKSQDSLQNNQLYVRELYNLSLDADMVVLSACETGIGELKKGEGVISLARAFTYAGAKSTITSLWNVNDAQTTKLMTLFYTNLKQGMRKDEALHKAKLTYIENEDLAAPYFWAAFIPAGNMEAIHFNGNNTTYYLIAGLLLAFVLGLGIFKARKKRS